MAIWQSASYKGINGSNLPLSATKRFSSEDNDAPSDTRSRVHLGWVKKNKSHHGAKPPLRLWDVWHLLSLIEQHKQELNSDQFVYAVKCWHTKASDKLNSTASLSWGLAAPVSFGMRWVMGSKRLSRNQPPAAFQQGRWDHGHIASALVFLLTQTSENSVWVCISEREWSSGVSVEYTQIFIQLRV